MMQREKQKNDPSNSSSLIFKYLQIKVLIVVVLSNIVVKKIYLTEIL